MVVVVSAAAWTHVPARHKSHPAFLWTVLCLGCLRKACWGKAFSPQAIRLENDLTDKHRGIKCHLPSSCSAGDPTQNFVHARQALNQLSHVHSPIVWAFAWITVSVSGSFCSLGSPFQDLTGTKCLECKSDRMLCNPPTPLVTSLPVGEAHNRGNPNSLEPCFPSLCHSCEKNYTPCSSTMLCPLTDNSLGFRKPWLISQVPSSFKTLFKVLFVCFVF